MTQINARTPRSAFKGHFSYVARARREERHVEADKVLGDFGERIVAFSEAQARKEGERCMSCGMGTVKANQYRRFSASNPAERGGNS